MGNKFKFATHLVNIKNANSKFNEITKVKKYMTAEQKTLIISSCIIWMFWAKYPIGRINKIHEPCLRLVQQNYLSDFEIVLENTNEKSIQKIA